MNHGYYYAFVHKRRPNVQEHQPRTQELQNPELRRYAKEILLLNECDSLMLNILSLLLIEFISHLSSCLRLVPNGASCFVSLRRQGDFDTEDLDGAPPRRG